MTVTALRELDIMTPTPDSAAAKPQGVHAGCLQEQFTGPVPARSERPMAENDFAGRKRKSFLRWRISHLAATASDLLRRAALSIEAG